jgi:2-oxoglutarate ferredoxin oxidoreductase subunit alpha
MRLNFLIGGKAGQGINKVSEIVTRVVNSLGYFTFNYRDYQSLIRGGHNFNVIAISDFRVGSVEKKVDGILALDDLTLKKHKEDLKEGGLVIDYKGFKKLGRNLNMALAGALIRILGIDKEVIIKEVEKEFDKDAMGAVEKGYSSQEKKYELKKLKNKISIMTGSEAVAKGAVNSGINLYIAYPMTPATGVMHELALNQKKNGMMVFQPENEIAVVNSSLGASFTGAKVMVGTSGGGFDLMTEGLSLQGISEIPLTVYLASRPGPGTGVPTYTSQADLDIALRGGHGEFPRVVIAPGDAIESVEKSNEAMYLAEKFRTLSIILGDKHLAESEFSSDRKPNKRLKFKIKRKVPGEGIVKASSYEHDDKGNTKEDEEIAVMGAERRLRKYEEIKKEVEKFEMIKTYGSKKAKNLVIGWGSTKTVILDALDEIDGSIKKKGDWKFLQVLYLKPMSDKIKEEIKKAKKVVLVENNVTGQLGRLIREKTGINIKNRILKYDARPFFLDELKNKLEEIK